jgi:dTDP-4-amino-4,6-dideoxygalactose transaminase
MKPEFIRKNKTLLKRAFNEWITKASKSAEYGSAIFGRGYVKEIEDKFCTVFNSKYAVALSSATAGLHTALFSSGIKRGNHVLILEGEWRGIDGAVKLSGGIVKRIIEKPKNKKNYYNVIEKSISPKLKAIIVVRQENDKYLMKLLSSLCLKNKIILIEDWADLKKITTNKAPEYGDFAVFSFGYNKWMEAGEGGMLLCNNTEFYVKAVQFTQHPIYQRVRLTLLNQKINQS